MARLAGCAVLAMTLGLPSCTAPKEDAAVGHPDPSVKIRGYKKAARERDMSAVRQMVKDLDSDDPAVRFYAIRGLNELAGQDLGYRYYDDEDQRREALGRWQEWLTHREAAVQADR